MADILGSLRLAQRQALTEAIPRGPNDEVSSRSLLKDLQAVSPPEVPSNIVDMEGYAIAKACIRAGVPFTCWKFVTDLADENATANWRENVEKGAAAFIALVETGGLEP